LCAISISRLFDAWDEIIAFPNSKDPRTPGGVLLFSNYNWGQIRCYNFNEGGLAMRRVLVLAFLTVMGVLSIAAGAQEDAAAIRLEKVKDTLYLVTGGRGPGEGSVSGVTTVFIADAGVVVVDTKYPGYGKTILDLVKSVTAKPIIMIVN